MPAKFIFLMLIFFGFFSSSSLKGEETQKKGTLIVSYQTGPKGERLDRIRFWLKGENKFLQMYPKDSHVVEDVEAMTRTVVIDDLSPGSYTIEFVIPNIDGLFEQILPKTVAIEKGSIVKVNQLIKPHFATLDIEAQNEKGKLPLSKNPSIALKNPLGHVEAHADTDRLSISQLLPGQYIVIFGDIEGFITPSPVDIHLHAGEKAGPVIGIYKPLTDVSSEPAFTLPALSLLHLIFPPLHASNEEEPYPLQLDYESFILNEEPTGSLFLSYSLKPDFDLIDRIRFKILENSESLFPQKDEVMVDPSDKEWIVYLQNLPIGSYNLVFYFSDLQENLHELKRLPFEILEDRMSSIHEAFESSAIQQLADSAEVGTLGTPPKIEFIGKELELIAERENPSSWAILNVNSSLPQSHWVIYQLDEKVYTGEGSRSGIILPSGNNYRLQAEEFNEYKQQVAPADYFDLHPSEIKNVSINYERKYGVIDISTLIPTGEKIEIIIEPEEPSLKKFSHREVIQSINGRIRWESPVLATGQYIVRIVPSGNYIHPEPEKIVLHSAEHLLLTPNFVKYAQFNESPRDDYTLHSGREEFSESTGRFAKSRLLTVSNIPEAGFTLYRLDQRNELTEGHFKGMHNSITLEPDTSYKIVFDQVPNYQKKDPINIELKEGAQKLLSATYLIKPEMISIPAGLSIFGDPFGDGSADEKPAKTVEINAFSIGKYEVTNAQYADWLNNAYQKAQVLYLSEEGKTGFVVDLQGNLLFKTMESELLSQIVTRREGEDKVTFASLPGKENNPVVFVSWFGSQAFCKDNGGRLPTEAEWEKAAGMEIGNSNSQTLKKFKYGFGKDSIDSTWANYKDNDNAIKQIQVLTKVVGFYNGDNWLPRTETNPRPIKTNHAISPAGAYDMSGNVYEWVSDWYDSEYLTHLDLNNPSGPANGTEKIVKGGCYDSLAQSLRVSQRLPLPAEHTDPFTGFRMAASR